MNGANGNGANGNGGNGAPARERRKEKRGGAEPTPGRESGETLGRESGETPDRESGETLDRESGEPVVELVPARVLETGAVSGGTAHRVGPQEEAEPAPEPADPGGAAR